MDATCRRLEAVNHRQAGVGWPTGLLGPAPGLKEVVVFCWSLFVATIFVPLFVFLWAQIRTGTISIRALNSDFVYVYGMGQIANEYPAAKLYDRGLQLKVFNTIYPVRRGSYGPSPYPPFVALFFKPFARSRFQIAYLAWAAISLSLYLTGIAAAIGSLFCEAGLRPSLVYCFALAYYPFLFGTLVNGQLSSIAIISVGLALYAERHNSHWWSGLALSLLAYKPTLLVLLLPMLLLTRRWKAFAGFVIGAAMLCGVATIVDGPEIWPAYVHLLRGFGQDAGLAGQPAIQVSKYIDLHSLTCVLPDGLWGRSSTPMLIAGACFAASLVSLLWRSSRSTRDAQYLAWAATLTWTLLLNVYVPIYDSVLVTPALILTLSALESVDRHVDAIGVAMFAFMIAVASWKTVAIAAFHGVQVLSIMLALLGCAQMWWLYGAIRRGTAPVVPTSVEV